MEELNFSYFTQQGNSNEAPKLLLPWNNSQPPSYHTRDDVKPPVMIAQAELIKPVTSVFTHNVMSPTDINSEPLSLVEGSEQLVPKELPNEWSLQDCCDNDDNNHTKSMFSLHLSPLPSCKQDNIWLEPSTNCNGSLSYDNGMCVLLKADSKIGHTESCDQSCDNVTIDDKPFINKGCVEDFPTKDDYTNLIQDDDLGHVSPVITNKVSSHMMSCEPQAIITEGVPFNEQKVSEHVVPTGNEDNPVTALHDDYLHNPVQIDPRTVLDEDGKSCDEGLYDKGSYDRESCDKESCDRESCDKESCDRESCDKKSCDRESCDKGSFDKVSCDKEACDFVVDEQDNIIPQEVVDLSLISKEESLPRDNHTHETTVNHTHETIVNHTHETTVNHTHETIVNHTQDISVTFTSAGDISQSGPNYSTNKSCDLFTTYNDTPITDVLSPQAKDTSHANQQLENDIDPYHNLLNEGRTHTNIHVPNNTCHHPSPPGRDEPENGSHLVTHLTADDPLPPKQPPFPCSPFHRLSDIQFPDYDDSTPASHTFTSLSCQPVKILNKEELLKRLSKGVQDVSIPAKLFLPEQELELRAKYEAMKENCSPPVSKRMKTSEEILPVETPVPSVVAPVGPQTENNVITNTITTNIDTNKASSCTDQTKSTTSIIKPEIIAQKPPLAKTDDTSVELQLIQQKLIEARSLIGVPMTTMSYNLSKPRLRIGLSKRRQCQRLHTSNH